MRIAYFYNEEWEKDFVIKHFPDDIFNFVKGTTKDNAALRDPDVSALSIFVNSPVRADVLDRFPNVKFIATRSTGYDHIDLAEVARRGIVVSNVPTYGEHTVAEFAFALLLGLSRRIVDAYTRIETTGSFSQEGLRGFDLRGKTIGVVGTGHIGEHMIKMAKGFDMNVLAFDVFPKAGLAEKLGFTYVSLDELIGSSDVVTLHAPYNEHTHHMINKDNIGKFKRGCYLINTSRGGLVETVALVKGLEDGTLAGAGLDVLEEEGQMVDENMLIAASHPNEESLRTVLANHYLMNHPHVLVTAHIAFNTQEAIERILNITINNITAFKNASPINLVKQG
jgi:D-lactate dehydrogenase